MATAKKPDVAKSNYEVAKTLKLESDGYYYFAELSKLAGESDKVYRDNLYLASLALSKAMPEKAYKYINRDYGVYYDKEEIELQGLNLIGVVPQDDTVYECDCAGKPTSQLPADSPVKKALYQILDNLNL